MIGSIAANSTALSQAQLGQQINMSVAKKTLDAAKASGNAAISLLETAARVQQESMAALSGKGQKLDVVG